MAIATAADPSTILYAATNIPSAAAAPVALIISSIVRRPDGDKGGLLISAQGVPKVTVR